MAELTWNSSLIMKDQDPGLLIKQIENFLEKHNKPLAGHSKRVASLSLKLGKKLGLPEDELKRLKLVSMLHDIGKLEINPHVLLKKEMLTPEEINIIRHHSSISYNFALQMPAIKNVAYEILCHHEKWDGTGYPHGLTGESIPYLTRIVSIIDAYDAMTSDRSYQKARGAPFAVEEIHKNAGTQFDPELARIFIEDILSAV